MTKLDSAWVKTSNLHLLYKSTVFTALFAISACSTPFDAPNEVIDNATERLMVSDFRLEANNDGILLDDQELSDAVITAVFGPTALEKYVISGSLKGAFTEENKNQTLHMIVPKAPMDAIADNEPPVLAVFENGQLHTQFVSQSLPYRLFAGAADADQDGVLEVVLAVSRLQMGTYTTAADVFSFKDGQRTLLQTFEAVFENSCESPFNNGQVMASALVITQTKDPEWRQLNFVAPCEEGVIFPAVDKYRPELD